MATQMPTSAEVIGSSQTNAQQKVDIAAMVDYVIDHLGEGLTAGTSTAYTLTPVPAITAYAAYQSFNIKLHTASGANPTLNISGIGATLNLVRRVQSGAYVNYSSIPAGQYRITLVSTTQALVENAAPAIVGTVSQTGGVPTGAIVEAGSNANGTYIKWADGTLICTNRISDPTVPSTNAFTGGGFYSGGITWTYPVAFLTGSTPNVIGQALGLTAFGVHIAVTPTDTGTQYVYLSVNSQAAANRVSFWQAFGRWF